MDKPAHTPGPWRVFLTRDGRHVIGVGDQKGGGITDQGDVATNDQGVWRSGQEKIANAYLIAASPMLLEGAQDAVAALKLIRIGLANGVIDEPKMIEVIDAHVDELQYAIAKASATPETTP